MSELGKIAHDAFCGTFGSSYGSYDELGESLQRGWDAAADAIASRAIAATRLHDQGDGEEQSSGSVTPGRAAHDTWCADDDWDELDDEARGLWEDAAQAAIATTRQP